MAVLSGHRLAGDSVNTGDMSDGNKFVSDWLGLLGATST